MTTPYDAEWLEAEPGREIHDPDSDGNHAPETAEERAAAIEACPTPYYHNTHRYCPSCPWTEPSGNTVPTLETVRDKMTVPGKLFASDEMQVVLYHLDEEQHFVNRFALALRKIRRGVDHPEGRWGHNEFYAAVEWASKIADEALTPTPTRKHVCASCGESEGHTPDCPSLLFADPA